MSLDEPTARRVVLAQAIEEADTQGRLLTPAERDQIDREARKAAGAGTDTMAAVSPEHFIDVRAQRVLAAVGVRHPGIVALQGGAGWQSWVAAGAPLAAVVLGMATDAVANPHRLDLVSLPLLGVVAWNLVVYLLLAGSWLIPARTGERPFLAGVGRWADGERAMRRRPAGLQTHVAALFHLRWHEASRGLHMLRVQRVLHLAAAGWAVGIALSLLMRGLVVEYRVGWESTFLGAEQVHAILSVLRLPALLLFPFEPFTVQEVATLRFSQGGGAVGGARWVYMYVALLVVLVVAPRGVLAAWAWWRERRRARRVGVNLDHPYYRRLVSLLHSARLQLCLVTHREPDRAAVLRVLAQDADGAILVRSAQDDVLRLVELSGEQAPGPTTVPTASGWAARLFGRLGRTEQGAGADPALVKTRDESDVVVHVCSGPEDLSRAAALLGWLGKPVLVLANPSASNDVDGPGLVSGCRAQLEALPVRAELLAFDTFARCWPQERLLIDAIARLVPEAKAEGFARLAATWDERSAQRLARSMGAIAEHLLYAAQQTEEVRTGALTVRNLMPAERQAQALARQQAMDGVIRRLGESAAQMFARLRKLHELDERAAGLMQQELQQKFVVQQSIDTPQAGVAGAATGAAMGASVDLMVGGLTLGAATALGALVGGSAAFIAAAWKNRATASGSTLVQLSDEMMQAMVEAALLRYLAVVHFGRGAVDPGQEAKAAWNDEVARVVGESRTLLTPFWSAARIQPDTGRLALALSRELEIITRKVLAALYPALGVGTRRA